MSATLIRNGIVYDGKGGPGRPLHVLIRDGFIAELSEQPIAVGPEVEEIDADGCWVTPGFIDIHTHYDAELEIAPGLSESVRHGVTTVILGSCSLSLVVGDPTDLADMFCRVEAIPRSEVLPVLQASKSWNSPKEYLHHLDTLPLGPNVATLLGHSTIRAAAMGLQRSLESGIKPTPSENARMHQWLEEALDEGFLGMSISTLPWDKMDGEAFRSRPMPSVFASWSEYRALAKVLRARGRVLQAVPNISTKVNVLLFYFLSTGLLRKSLKTTLISMMDVRSDRFAFRIAGFLARAFNKLFRADFKMQAIPEVFDLYADGIDVVVFEEFEAGTAALHLQDVAARTELLADPSYRKRFKKQWKRKWMPRAYHRNLRFATIVDCPDQELVGKTFHEIGLEKQQDSIDVFLDLVCAHGTSLRWHTVMGNDRPEWLRWIVNHPDAQMGFSDAGAHLRNMAHYNFPLRLLKMVRDSHDQNKPIMSVGRAVQRLTSELAEWMGLDVGTLEVGRKADLVVIRPEGLNEELETVHEAPSFGIQRLVRRSQNAVKAVLVSGKIAARDGTPSQDLGSDHDFGRVLRAGRSYSAGSAKEDQPDSATRSEELNPISMPAS